MKVLIINGANLNMLGNRDKGFYGIKSLQQINSEIEAFCLKNNVEVEFFQSNYEGALIERIQSADCPIIINCGAYCHYSLAIKDALADCKQKKIEVHLSNIFAREGRERSITASACDAVIAGFKEKGYILAISALLDK